MTVQSLLGIKKGSNPAPQVASGDLLSKIDKAANHLLDLPKRVGYGSERIKLTPELAQHYLTFNRNNWDVIQWRVDAYAEEMLRGEWKENGEGIKFSKSGRLVDGQHRLLAILKAGVALHMYVFYGIDEDADVTINTGRTKTARGVMTVQGLPRWEAQTLGTAIHRLINRSQGLPLCSSVQRLNREVEDFYLEHSDRLKASTTFIADLPRRSPIITHSAALALHFCFAERDTAAADEFVGKLFAGDALAKSSPVYQLRELVGTAQRAGKRLTLRQQMHACIKAWNYVRAHRSLSSARTLLPRSDEPLPEIG